MPDMPESQGTLSRVAARYPRTARAYRRTRALVKDGRARAFRLACRARARGLIRRYLAEHPEPKLQVGAGGSLLDGWLNTDKYPVDPRVVYLDAEIKLPFADGTFHYIFCEHLIEHISYDRARRLLSECFRVLRPGGVLRITTPDLGRMAGLYCRPDQVSPPGRKYLDYMAGRYFPEAPGNRPVHLLNTLFYGWGHRFLYDRDLLSELLLRAGFSRVVSCEYGESLHEALRGVCSHGRAMGSEEAAGFECFILEAGKAGA